MRTVEKSNDGMVMIIWLIACIALVLFAGLAAAREPLDFTGYNEPRNLASKSRSVQHHLQTTRTEAETKENER